MELNSFNKILVIISTKSRKFKQIYNKINTKLSNILNEDKFDILLTKDEFSNRNFTEDYISKYTNLLVISVGGDGSLSEISNTIYRLNREDVYFGFLPNGTGNDFSKAIYPNKYFDDILEKIDNIEVKKIDLIKINDNTSINVAAFGFESIVLLKSIEIKEKFPILSNLSFLIAIFLCLNKIKPISYDYSLKFSDDRIQRGSNKKLLNSLCNGNYYGGGFMPAPKAEVDDGIIQFNTIENVSILKLLSLIKVYKTSKHQKLSVSKTYNVVSGKIISKENEIVANIDGNPFIFKELEFEVLNKVLNLVVFKN